VSMVFGMVKNKSERDDCTSILFKAFRMELNLILLHPTLLYALDPGPDNHLETVQNQEFHPGLES
jgi:hypothetical protein